jgi:putative flippase GtrA
MLSVLATLEKNGTPQRGTRLLRFVAAGTGNTLISLGVYQAALFFMGHLPAYLLAYAVGIALAYYLYARHVFHAQTSKRGFALFAVFYTVAGAIGSAVNSGLIEGLGWHARLAIFVTVLLMLPVNYLGSRWCILSAPAKHGGPR